MSLDEFSRWIDATLEDASFVPNADADAQVVVTPLERAMLRPFGAWCCRLPTRSGSARRRPRTRC